MWTTNKASPSLIDNIHLTVVQGKETNLVGADKIEMKDAKPSNKPYNNEAVNQ